LFPTSLPLVVLDSERVLILIDVSLVPIRIS
jgi:hypothetical protein